jgi:hypothetical protein
MLGLDNRSYRNICGTSAGLGRSLRSRGRVRVPLLLAVSTSFLLAPAVSAAKSVEIRFPAWTKWSQRSCTGQKGPVGFGVGVVSRQNLVGDLAVSTAGNRARANLSRLTNRAKQTNKKGGLRTMSFGLLNGARVVAHFTDPSDCSVYALARIDLPTAGSWSRTSCGELFGAPEVVENRPAISPSLRVQGRLVDDDRILSPGENGRLKVTITNSGSAISGVQLITRFLEAAPGIEVDGNAQEFKIDACSSMTMERTVHVAPKAAAKPMRLKLIARADQIASATHEVAFTVGAPKRPWLGAVLTSVNAEQAAKLGYGPEPVVLVREIRTDSPAEKAGLKVKDWLVSVDGKVSASLSEYKNFFAASRPGQRVKLRILRLASDKTSSLLDLFGVIGER